MAVAGKPVYALANLLHDREVYEIGARIDDKLHPDVVEKLLANGQAAMTKPKE